MPTAGTHSISAISIFAGAIGPRAHARRQRLLNKRLAQTQGRERAKALANAVFADCRSRCISDAGRRLVNTVLAALKEYEAASGRKYARHGERVTAFATAVEGFIGDLMLARNNSAAGGWVFRPLHHRYFASPAPRRSLITPSVAGRASNRARPRAHRDRMAQTAPLPAECM
jgi:hypothetical protein